MHICKRYDECKNKNVESICTTCKEYYNESHFVPVDNVPDKDGCLCISCKRIITDGRIFPIKYNNKTGLCYDCY